MAPSLLANQNESSWAHMGKIPYSNHHLNSNSNPNPKKKKKQFHHAADNGVFGRYNQNVDSPSVTHTASDDAYSFNQTSTSRNAVNYGSYLTFSLASYTKSELIELRKRLSAELQQTRDLQDRIESCQFINSGNSRSHPKIRKGPGHKRPISAFCSVPNTLSNGFDNRIPQSVNFLDSLKECRQIVGKLMKHKHGYVFKQPVDAQAMGLHDYHHIVKQPMDLGTVKSNLDKNLYATPGEFASDVRLTFNNALLYNPKTDPVHGMAQQILARFEELYRPIQEKIDTHINQLHEGDFHKSNVDNTQFHGNDELQENSFSYHNMNSVSSMRGKKEVNQKASPVWRKAEMMQMHVQEHSSASTPSNHPSPALNHHPNKESIPSPARAPHLPVKDPKVARGSSGTSKQPKPRARDLNKRDMSMEEKHKLGIDLQSLPQEKMPQLLHIISKRNEHLAQDGDEIELDIEALDTETLWELDRFVTNWKKMVSKTKRQALMTNTDAAAGVVAPSTPINEADTNEPVKKLKDNDDEDVDIDDDMPATSFPPIEIVKEDDGTQFGGQKRDLGDSRNPSSSSSSSGSSSSDSSSSDSDTGSLSGSDSDADDAQS